MNNDSEEISSSLPPYRLLLFVSLCVFLLDSEDLVNNPQLLTSDAPHRSQMCAPSSTKKLANSSQFAFPNETDCLEAASISWDFIDKIIYINARHSIDRNEVMLRDFLPVFKKSSEDVIQFDETYESTLIHAQRVAKSHIGALQLALDGDFRNVLVLEDDVLWRVDPNRVNLLLLQDLVLKPYDVIIFGGTFVHHDDDHRARHSYASSSYLVNGDYILTLLGNYQEGLMKLNLEPGIKMYSIDVWRNRLMKHDLWYIVTPALVIQSSYPVQFGYSESGADM